MYIVHPNNNNITHHLSLADWMAGRQAWKKKTTTKYHRLFLHIRFTNDEREGERKELTK